MGTTIKLCAFSDEAADSLDGQISALTRNEILLTELRSVDKVNVSALTERAAHDTAGRLRTYGISVWAVGSPLGKTDISVSADEWSESVKRICGIANALDTDKVRAFSFFNAYDRGGEVVDRLCLAAEIAKAFGVTLYHENEKAVYGDTLERVAFLMQNLPGWKFVYDPANFIQCGQSARSTLRLAPKCDYYHIKDVVASTGEIVPASVGDGEIPALIDRIDKDTTFTVEPHLALFSAFSQIDGTRIKLGHVYPSGDAAFDAAVAALKDLLNKCGFKAHNGSYTK